ncbi:MAG: hypothetical protein JWQ25_2935 [Daejeonella sp.]|nr:hypothetical protein [Daejeonella sp.]
MLCFSQPNLYFYRAKHLASTCVVSLVFPLFCRMFAFVFTQ